MPGQEMLDLLREADPLYIVLDPDAYLGKSPAINRMARMLPGITKYLVKLPVKADDFFTTYGGTPREFTESLELRRLVC